MEYKIINSENIEKFNIEINSMLKNGWELYGTPFIRLQMDYCQAMILKTNTQNIEKYSSVAQIHASMNC